MKLSIIIPAYNEEKTIEKTIERVSNVFLQHVIKEIIIVDDGSTDKTTLKIKNYNLKEKNTKVIFHRKNAGKGNAIKTGIRYATGEYILIQDADAEYNPQDIVRLLQPIQNNTAQVVYGSRLKRLPNFNNEEKTIHFFVHYLGNKLLSLLTSILYGAWITDMETGYKIFPKKAVVAMQLHSRGFEFEPEITAKLLKAGYKINEIPITTSPRGYKEGKKLHTIHDGSIALWTILKYRFSD